MADPISPAGNDPPPRPRWVKIFGIVVAFIVVLVVVVALLGGGEHGPGRHRPGGGDAARLQSAP